MGTLKYVSRTLILLFFLTFFYSCASEKHLITDRARSEELAGTYTLLLYGARHSDDVANVAILDREGDPYTIEIYAPEFDYSVKKGMSANDALAEAGAHVKYHRDFIRSRLVKIIDDKGNTFGYELRPLYHIDRYGQSDVLSIDYMMKDGKVMTLIKVKDYLLERDREWFRGRPD